MSRIQIWKLGANHMNTLLTPLKLNLAVDECIPILMASSQDCILAGQPHENSQTRYNILPELDDWRAHALSIRAVSTEEELGCGQVQQGGGGEEVGRR